MARDHQINRIKVGINGKLESELAEILKRLVPKISEKYFDQFSPNGSDIFIDNYISEYGEH